MFCTQCGARIKDTARFCPKCGAAVPDESDSVGVDSTAMTETQPSHAQAPAQPMSASQQVDQQRQPSMPAGKTSSAPKKFPVVAVALILALTTLGGLGFAWYKGLIKLPFLPKVPAATQLALTVEAPGLDEGSSRVPVRVSGTTEAGEAFDQQTYLTLGGAENEPIVLKDGTYSVEVIGSPISSDGVIYSYEEAKKEVTVPEPDASEGDAKEPIKLELVPIEAAEVTDEQIAEAADWARNDSERADMADALQEVATTRRNEAIPLGDRVVTSYEEVLDNAQSYFADEWFGKTFEGEIRYFLVEMTGDDIPELILSARYEGIGPNGNPRKRYLPFVFDASTGATQPVAFESDELSMYEDSWTSYYQGADHHSLICEQKDGWDSPYEYFRVWAEGSQLMREGASASDRIGDMTDGYGGLLVTDRTYLEWLRDKLNS